MRTRITSAIPWLALTSVVSLLLAGLAVFIPVTASGQQASAGVTQTKKMDNEYGTSAGQEFTGTVTVSQTEGLVRQRVKVSWSGLRPSTSEMSNAAYPVVVMQCWGAPDQVTQQTCWSAGANVGTSLDYGVYDAGPFDPAVFGERSEASMVPFKARDDGKLYSGLGHSNGWPEGAVVNQNPPAFSTATANAVMPNASLGVTRSDGTGETDIELLTDFELPHLGCSSTAACSLVVIPIGDPRCGTEFPELCGPDLYSEPIIRDYHTWITPTNWSRRFTFPLSFREAPAVCALDNRQETSLAGSPYLYQLLNNSWRPKFCHDDKLFKLGYTMLSDGEARAQFGGALTGQWRDGSTNALLTSRPLEGEAAKPFVYAPVAVSSVAVSFVLDGADRKEVTELRLNARLLAKLLTQSYRTMAAAGSGHPALRNNPAWWGADPEFGKLNPALAGIRDLVPDGADYPVISLGDMDAIYALTAYIAADKDAVAWLNGANDGWGMFVNPKFHEYKLPVGLLELRDDYVVPDGHLLKGQILLTQFANVADNLYNAAIAATQAWPYANISESCTDDPSTTPPTRTCVLKRKDQRQPAGSRAMLAITTLGDSRVFNLRQAALQTAAGSFVAPDDYSIALALRGTKVDEKTGVLTTDFAKLHPVAYPGMSVVYAAVPTTGLSAGTAGNYAKFLEYAAGPGQVKGTAAGQLPAGYVPLSDPLKEQTLNAARAVREQKGEVPPPPRSLTEDPAGGLLPPAGGNNGTDNVTGGGANGDQPAGAATPAPSTPASDPATVDKETTSVATRTDSSDFSKWVLPGLLALSLLAGLVAFGAMVWTQPQHPVRRVLRSMFARRS